MQVQNITKEQKRVSIFVAQIKPWEDSIKGLKSLARNYITQFI